MQKVLILGTLACFGLGALTTNARIAESKPSVFSSATQNPNKSEPIRTFTGTITKNGDQFVLNESKTHKLYELDDQNAASKFAEQNVTITGTLDAVKNIIRIQSIAEAAA